MTTTATSAAARPVRSAEGMAEALWDGGRGIVGPSHDGAACDVLAGLALDGRVDRLVAVLEAGIAHVRPAWRPLVDGCAAAWATSDRAEVRSCLATPWAAWDLGREPWPLESVVDDRDTEARLVSTWRHLVLAPGAPDLAVVIPAGAVADDLVLPHAGVVLPAGTGPLAVVQQGDGVELVWDDGAAVELRRDASGSIAASVVAGSVTGRIAGTPGTPGRPLAGSDASVRRAFAAFGPLSGEPAEAVARAHEDGLLMLRAVWPEAATSARRSVSGWLPVSSTVGERSHTSPRLPGVVLSSATTSVEAALAIVHESAHLRLQTLLDVDPLLENGLGDPVSSPWRADPRPLLGLLLGVHAFLDVVRFLERLARLAPGRTGEVAHRRARHHADQLQQGWATLRRQALPTALGSLLLDALAEEVTT